MNRPRFGWLRAAFGLIRIREFGDAIRGELSEMRVPAADDALLARIRASRRAGARVILPLDDTRRSRRPLFVASAIAAAVVAVAVMGRVARDTGSPLASSGDSWFGSDVAYASAPRPQRFPAVRITRADRMRPMALRYDWTMRDSTGQVARSEIRMAVTRDTVAGRPAWRLVSSRTLFDGSTQLDSVWVSPGSFAPLRQTIVSSPYRRYEKLTVWQYFDGLHARGEMNAILGGRLSARRTFDRQLSSDAAPYVADAFAPLYHIGVDMSPGWSGRVSVLGWLVRDDNIRVPLAFRVAGGDIVRVPAGTFDCWRLEVESHGRKRWYWVRKSDGLGVRVLDSNLKSLREISLASESF